MALERRFLIAPSLARLIRRERGVAARVVEGHFAQRSDRSQWVRVDEHQSYLVLKTSGPGGELQEEQIEIPRSHAEALVDVATSAVAFDRTPLSIGSGVEATLDGFILPKGLDLLTVTLTSNPAGFYPLPWFGREVTNDGAFQLKALALNGSPGPAEIEVSNAALDALLDFLEGRAHSSRPTTSPTLRLNEVPTPAANGGELLRSQAPGPDAVRKEPSPQAVAALPPESLRPPKHETPPAATEAPKVEDQAAAGTALPKEPEQATAAESGGAVRWAAKDRPGATSRPKMETPELDAEIVRMARSLAPRRLSNP